MFGCVDTIIFVGNRLENNSSLPFYVTNPALHHKRNDPETRLAEKYPQSENGMIPVLYGDEVCSNDPGRITKMVAFLIYN